ncbi:TlpA disulfide reductase family protein [Paucibacter sp. PLA-PC-4]|uniref:TlpA family protein disulfide reductase n=1 Tax=Paucibacter sp. PLA-PC-4 TaxID=2993655 RepID=UPI0022495089|nr:TlpA disulfide reductase family protein [Paucibacter sp. PLA-PC-4]MCX2863337.1 TlpA disulfide reductase family protein [Paucibacter sp. PLA-PC-4]
MLSISLGPVALPLAPALLLCAVWAASLLARRLARKAAGESLGEVAGNTVIHAALLGLLAARLAYLALNADAYLASPWAAFDLRDGGWFAPAGLIAGLGWLAWRSQRRPPLRRPWLVSSGAGIALWLLASVATAPSGSAPMPSVQLAELESAQSLSLSEAARGRPVVVNLWASWCGPCRVEMPVLAAAQQRESAVGFLFINQGESPAAVKAFLRQQGLSLREVLLDSRSTLGPAVGSRGLPTTLFYDAQGRQVDAHFGIINAAALESRLRQIRPSP